LPTEFLELKQSIRGSGKLALDVGAIDRERILSAASKALELDPPFIARHRAKLSAGGPNDFYSNADYFWPDPTKPDGLPYMNRDGESNPGNFNEHRMAMRDMRDAVAALAAAYKITGEERYVTKAVSLLRVFFLDPATRMNPHLRFGQSIPGVCDGRGIGIIDTEEFVDLARLLHVAAPAQWSADDDAALKGWFGEYLDWLLASPLGLDERLQHNNHGTWFDAQVASALPATRRLARR
jgi:hypothetical protein